MDNDDGSWREGSWQSDSEDVASRVSLDREGYKQQPRPQKSSSAGHDLARRLVQAASTSTLIPPGQGMDLADLPVLPASGSPTVTVSALPPSYAGDYDPELDLETEHELEHAEQSATYSSLPPSPRGGEHSRELELDDVFDRLDLKTLDVELNPSPRRRRLSLDSASAIDQGSELDEIDDFWPARSRRATMDSPMGEREQFWPARSRRPTMESSLDEGEQYWPARSRRHTVESLHGPPSVTLQQPHSPIREEEEERDSGSSPEPPNIPGDEKLSIWELLKDEDAAEHWEGWIADGKWERIANFLAVPLAVEKVTMFGALLCLDGFLYNFTILPIRATFAATRIVTRLVKRESLTPLPPSHVQSVLRILLLVIPAAILLVSTDASKMYHTVRGQDTIKLYVIFNALEIGDRLCCAFGQDVLDTLFARDTLDVLTYNTDQKRRKREHVRPAFYFTLSLGYVVLHSLIFLYMLIALNVAINSYDYTLISLLISNQFVEIKGSVFKKFEKENLFQIMCADIVERFQLGLMLSVIAIRNMVEMAGSDLAFLPKSFTRGKSLMERILSPVLFVLASEMLVDWLKHAFIAKFNHVRASVYGRFTDVLAKDVLLAGTIGDGRGRHQRRKHPILLDQSPLVARRLGIASVPLAVLVIRIGAQIVGMLTTMSSHAVDGHATADWYWMALKWIAGLLIGICAWGCLIAVKVLLGLALLSYSALRQSSMDEREAEDTVNDFGRAPVGISKDEIAYNKKTTAYLSRAEDDLPDHTAPRPSANDKRKRAVADGAQTPGGKKKTFKLEEVERWTMVKRIW